MNFKKLIDLSGLNKSREVPPPEPVKEVPTFNDESNKKLDMIINMINEINQGSYSNGEEYGEFDKPLKTTLNDEETMYLMNYMMDLHDEYFPDNNLSLDLKPEFIWNTPKAIITVSKKFADYGYPDMINPLTWLYMFCVDFDEAAFAKLLKQNLESIDNKAYNQIADIIENNEGGSNNEN